MEYFNLVTSQIITFIIYALIGVIAVKTKVLKEEGLDVISKLIIKITLPVMIFHNTISGATVEDFMNTLSIIAWTFVMYGLLFLLSVALRRLFKLQGNKGKVFQANVMFGNVGFMGIPIVATFFPEHGMLYMALFTVADQMVLWTAGVALTTPEDAAKNIDKKQYIKQTVKKFINPAVVAITLSVVFVLLQLQLPAELDTALSKVGAITSPLAMIYIGALFCFTDMISNLKRVEFYGLVAIKMVIVPLVFYWLMGLVPNMNADIRLTMTVIAALPSMTTIAMLAKTQGSEGEYSAGAIFVTTVCSIVTLPLVCYLITCL